MMRSVCFLDKAVTFLLKVVLELGFLASLSQSRCLSPSVEQGQSGLRPQSVTLFDIHVGQYSTKIADLKLRFDHRFHKGYRKVSFSKPPKCKKPPATGRQAGLVA